MSFTWPALLWLLLLVPLLAVGLGRAARRRTRTARALADTDLLPALLRQPPAAHARKLGVLQAAALAALLFAGARPVASPPLPTNKAAVVIALDASQSMQADDVNPSRLEAARALAQKFVRLAPASTRIGLVSFSDVASVLVPPTTDRQVVQEALEHIAPARNTSLAAAVVTGVKMLPGRQDAQPPEELAAPGAMRPGTRPPGTMPPEKDPGNAQAQELPPGSVLILSDGVANIGGTGISSEAALDLAARFAAEEHVKLFTLPVGTEGGTVTRIDGTDYFIPFDADALARLSQQSGGRSIEPADKAGLQELADELGTVIRWEPTRVEVSSLFALLGVLLMLAAGGLSLRWYRRVP